MSGAHSWGQICFSSLFIILHIFPLADSGGIRQLTFCDQKSSRSLLFVSTLDGKISALDADNHGEKQWTLDLSEGPMLSSSIHRRDLNNNGQWVRLIPSLSGGLYKFDGENLEAIPVTTEQLLHSSFRYSDDLVFSGGKETKSYGVSSRTGKILYECGISGCTNNTDGDGYLEQEVLIVQRFQQTVRAVEPRTGLERWNFSVGQHDLILVPHSDCHEKVESRLLDIEIKVIVPDGIIWAFNKHNPQEKLWQYKFDAPIVTIWREDDAAKNKARRSLKEINLFDSTQWSWGSEFSVSPGVYLGMHDRQLYVQENGGLRKSLEAPPKYMRHSRYPWQPYPAVAGKVMVDFVSGTAVTKTLPSPTSDKNSDDTLLEINDAQSTTALSVLYNSEYINGNGFYLYSKDQLELDNAHQCNGTPPDFMLIDGDEKPFVTNDTQDEDETPVQVIIVSLWYWWKEVLIISITTAVLLNFMLTQRLLIATTHAKDAVLPPLIVERHIEAKESSPKSVGGESIDNFKSRYLTDFEPVDCLGRGGYGVVFEAKNKIDDCNYAIKRIALPNSQYARERVMREVKALAKLDHHNIVRYFNAWLECPPAGWQEHHDEEWINKFNFPRSEFPTEATQTETKTNNFVCINVSQTDHSSVDSAYEAYALNSNNTEDDSYIVFAKSDKTGQAENVIDVNEHSTENSDLSNSSSVNEKILYKVNGCKHSESVTFEDTESECLTEKSKNKRHRSQFSLNLNSKREVQKSAKMFLYIQMQLCQRLSLREWLKKQPTRDTRCALNIFQQIVDAVEYVHLQGLIHRDLKPSNIFFAYDEKIKIGDFGLVTAMTEGCAEVHTPSSENEGVTLKNSSHTACVGTHLYMSPEQKNGQGYNYKVDIYSLGIILFELLMPFFTEMERVNALTKLRNSVFPDNFELNYPAEYDLLRMMLDGNPHKRPTTLGIKARPPLLNYETTNGFSGQEDSKWHFELPQFTRHSSVTSSSSGESWENVS